jgi:hypothetical protein
MSTLSDSNVIPARALEFKDVMTLFMSLSQRAHNAWSAYAAAALVVCGWLLTQAGTLSPGELCLVMIAILLGTLLNVYTTLAIYRYYNAVVEEARVAAQYVQFWNDLPTREAVRDLKTLSPTAAVLVNVSVATLLIGIAALGRLK